MTRVIAGKAGGHRLAVPGGMSTRPTSDRAREGLFATVLSEAGPLDGKRVLDLYAGSGAVGLEALSRGARHVLMVESDPRAVAVIKANIAALKLPGATVTPGRVERVLARPRVPAGPRVPARPPATEGESQGGYDLVFADPPYAVSDAEVTRVLGMLAEGWLAAGALAVVERATRSAAVAWPPDFLPGKSRRYGEATFWYGWYGQGAATGEAPGTVPQAAHEE
jgi:16S rRNA (guanine966-N2)-methyltransferase